MLPHLTLSTDELTCFPQSYSDARQKLQRLAGQNSSVSLAASFPLQVSESDPDGLLSTDLLWIGPATADNLVVLISATHGVEGFAGAAVQADFLMRIKQGYALPDNTAVMIIFALNPYGFENNRRCDESGVDLNRNFIDFSMPLPVNNDYQSLQTIIYNPDPSQRAQLFDAFRQTHGQATFEMAISGGQYHDPAGPFYGGKKASHGRKVIEQVIEQYHLATKQLAVIDIHTGLGAYAHGEIINDHPLDSHGYAIANQWYGASVTAPATGNSSSVIKQGLLDYGWHPLMHNQGCFVTLEFGSYSTENLFNVIIENHQCWQSADPAAISKSADAMKSHFCPADPYWKELVLVKARQVIQQAIDGLNNVQ